MEINQGDALIKACLDASNAAIEACRDASNAAIEELLDLYASKSKHNTQLRAAYVKVRADALQSERDEAVICLQILNKQCILEDRIHMLQIENANLNAKLAKICAIALQKL
jgi:hypothetical protein